jgi:EAL domain-containing protein (putative c-di-GMP-specific phosphodiesterase class I)
VTAEGVENDRQLAFLAAEGCDYAQGYYLSLPLARHEFAAMLRTTSVALNRSGCENHPTPAWAP